MMKCYMKNCVNNNEWACEYRSDCIDCSRDCKSYYKCSSCDYYMDEDIEEEFCEEDKIKFPCQYIQQYFRGECSFDYMIDATMDEVYRLIGEYVESHKEET